MQTAGIRSHYVQWSDQAIEPQGEAKPDYWIAQQLARRLGFGEQFDLTPEQMAENVLKPSGIKLADVMKAPVCPIGDKPYVPYEGGKFRTPNGKANIYVEAWQQKGFSPVVAYYRPKESPKGNPALATDYPLMSVKKKSMQGVHSSHHGTAGGTARTGIRRARCSPTTPWSRLEQARQSAQHWLTFGGPKP